MNDRVVDNPDRQRFEMEIEGRTAFVVYRRAPGVVRLVHAEVPRELEGRGIGGRLVAATLEAVRREDAKVVPGCTFVARYMREHAAEYADLIADR